MGIMGWLLSGAGKKVSTICPSCGVTVESGYQFCPECKARLDTKMLTCFKCFKIIEPTSKFCPFCQAPIDPGRAVKEATAIVWKRMPGQYARRMDLNLEAFRDPEMCEKGFIVEYGTRALMIADGALAGVLEPGRYAQVTGDSPGGTSGYSDMKGFLTTVTNAKKFVTIILVASGDTDLKFAYGLETAGTQQAYSNILISKDNLKVGVDLTATLRLADPNSFFQNLMGAEDNVGEDDLRAHFYEEFRDAVREEVAKCEAEQMMKADRQVKDTLQGNIMVTMRKSTQRAGMDIVQIRAVFVDQAQLREIVLRRGELEVGKKKLDLLRQFMSLETQQKVAAAQNSAELEKQLLAVDRDRIISAEEYNEIRTAFEQGRGNREMTMKFMQSKMEVMYGSELQRVKLIEEGKLKLTEIDNQISARTKQLNFEREQYLRKVEVEIAAKQKELEFWKEKNKAVLDMYSQRVQIDASVQMQMMKMLAELPPDTAALYMAQNPNTAQVLMARAQATGNQHIAQAYEKASQSMKDVAIAASTGGRATVAEAAQAMAVGVSAARGGAGVCASCGYNQIRPEFKVCPACGGKIVPQPQ
jgi:RNA polymerase subunit RPABC4/transcription elongation factor Spt4